MAAIKQAQSAQESGDAEQLQLAIDGLDHIKANLKGLGV
jgi:hypothetical protein